MNDSSVTLWHPVGATRARTLDTASRYLVRAGGEYLLKTIFIGGAQALAATFERA